MKLKELPKSLWLEVKMRCLNSASLHQSSDSDVPLIVSIATYSLRLKLVHKTVRSILSQAHKPEKVVLWVPQEHKGQLPSSLIRLQGPKFEIRFTSYSSSHRKLVECIRHFPASLVVTCDDDLFYQHDFLFTLYQDHLSHPDQIIGYECRRAPLSDPDSFQPYKRWPYVKDLDLTGPDFLSVGYAGALFPPGVLDDKVTDESLFMELCPKADDLWFKAMAMLKGTQVRRASRQNKPHPMLGSQQISLKKHNIEADANRAQWQKTLQYFGLIRA